jgi:hypothetical protein
MASIVVCGGVLRQPSGGNLAAHLHYLIGLRKLGHQVTYLEERGVTGPGTDEVEGAPAVPRAGIMLLGDLLRRCRVDVPVVWVDSDAGLVGGMVWPQLRRRLAEADLLLDLGGHCWLTERSLARRRVLIDLDSGPSIDRADRQTDHDVYFSYRRNPTALPGVSWLATIPPVVPRLWYGPAARPEMPIRVLADLTRQSLALHGVGATGPDVGRLLDLPDRIAPRPWTAVSADRRELADRLARAGWGVRDEDAVEGSLSSHRAAVIGSQATLSFRGAERARGIWFTAHDACFLAAGRPVIAGDRTLESWLPTGSGIVAFDGLDEAVEAVEQVRATLAAHAAAARGLAERVFHYRVVLPSLLEQALPRKLEAVA